jgi:hypothetical protein
MAYFCRTIGGLGMADSKDLNITELKVQKAFTQYFPHLLLTSPSPEDTGGYLESPRQGREKKKHVDIDFLLKNYIDKEREAADKEIFFNLPKMDRDNSKKTPFSPCFPQVSTAPKGKTPEEKRKYEAFKEKQKQKSDYMNELQKNNKDTKPSEPRVDVFRFFLLKEEELWKKGFNRSVIPELKIPEAESLLLVEDYLKWINKNKLYGFYDEAKGYFTWDFSEITEHRAHNLYAEFDYYAHKAVSCRKFGSELHRFENRPEELSLLPPDKETSLLDYLKGDGSRYAKEVHGGVFLRQSKKSESTLKGDKQECLSNSEVQINRRRNFLNAVHLNPEWEASLEKLYYTFFLAVKNMEWYDAEKAEMDQIKLFGEYAEENSKLGEEFIKYLLFKNFDRMDAEYFKIAHHFEKYRDYFRDDERFKITEKKNWDEQEDGPYENHIKEKKDAYKTEFKSAYKKKIDETMESFPKEGERKQTAETMKISLQDAGYLPWGLKELINRISMQKNFLYAIDAKRTLTESEKGSIKNWYNEIRKVTEEVIADLSKEERNRSGKVSGANEKITELKKKLQEILDKIIGEIQRKTTPKAPKGFMEILKLEQKLTTHPKIREKIKKKILNNVHNLCDKKGIERCDDLGGGETKTGHDDQSTAFDVLVVNDAFEKNKREIPLLCNNEDVKDIFRNYMMEFVKNEDMKKKLTGSDKDEYRKKLIDSLLLKEYRTIDQDSSDDEIRNQINKFLDIIIEEC